MTAVHVPQAPACAGDQLAPAWIRAVRPSDGRALVLRPVGELHGLCTLLDLPLHQAVKHPHVAGHVGCVVAPGFCAIAKEAAATPPPPDPATMLRQLQALSPDAKRVLAAQAVSAISHLHAQGFLCVYVLASNWERGTGDGGGRLGVGPGRRSAVRGRVRGGALVGRESGALGRVLMPCSCVLVLMRVALGVGVSCCQRSGPERVRARRQRYCPE